jgi:hypothetical protein
VAETCIPTKANGKKLRGIKWTPSGAKQFMAFGTLLAAIESGGRLKYSETSALRQIFEAERRPKERIDDQ